MSTTTETGSSLRAFGDRAPTHGKEVWRRRAELVDELFGLHHRHATSATSRVARWQPDRLVVEHLAFHSDVVGYRVIALRTTIATAQKRPFNRG